MKVLDVIGMGQKGEGGSRMAEVGMWMKPRFLRLPPSEFHLRSGR
jgi:hypothetical protein